MSFDPIDAAQKAGFVDFAYNMFTPGVLQPPPDPGIAKAGFELVYYLNASDFDTKAFYGYIARSTTNPGALVLAIRGTEDASEWLLDFLALPVPFTPDPDAGFVALGFLSIYDSFELVPPAGTAVSLTEAVTTLAAGTPIQSFTVIGHSLGSALATLAAAQLCLEDTAGVKSGLTIYTFASPRVGLLDFAATFDGIVPVSYRIWNAMDIVPQVPPFPYIHVSGMGDPIYQTVEQLTTLRITPACEHHLTSYQWLLDLAAFALDAACDTHTADVTVAAYAIRAEVADVPSTGAIALRKAMVGRL